MLITLVITISFKFCALGSSYNTILASDFNFFCILFRLHISEKNLDSHSEVILHGKVVFGFHGLLCYYHVMIVFS